MISPTWEALFGAVDELALPERSYPYSYQDLPLIKLFVYARIKDITAFQSLQKHLMMCPGVLALVGLEKAPHRKTLAARFRALSGSVLSLLHQLTERFIETGPLSTASRFAVPKVLLGPQPSAYTQLTSKTPTSSMTNSFIACPKPLRSCSATAVMTKRAATETAMNVKSPCSHPSRSKKHAVRAARTSQALPRPLHP